MLTFKLLFYKNNAIEIRVALYFKLKIASSIQIQIINRNRNKNKFEKNINISLQTYGSNVEFNRQFFLSFIFISMYRGVVEINFIMLPKITEMITQTISF